MTPSDIASALQQQFGDRIKASKLDALDPFVEVAPADLPAVCRFLRDDPRLKFELLLNISGVDYLEPDAKKVPKAGFEPHTEVVYHLSSFRQKHRFVLKVLLPRWKDNKKGELPEVPSVTSRWRTANWHEREIYDMMGIRFRGHPDLRRILMWEGYRDFPLRKDFPLSGKPTDLPEVAFTQPAPMAGGPFVTVAGGVDTIAREPRVRIPETDSLEANARLERRRDLGRADEQHGNVLGSEGGKAKT